jgi:hypothetical protein
VSREYIASEHKCGIMDYEKDESIGHGFAYIKIRRKI